MINNARPHRARTVQYFLRREAVVALPWPAGSPDLNPLKHIWEIIGLQRTQPIQTLDELIKALHQAWHVSSTTISKTGLRRFLESIIRMDGS